MKTRLTILTTLVILFYSCHYSPSKKSKDDAQPCGWQKIYENDAEGSPVFGDKSNLVEAVRAGYSVRIGFGEKPIEHVADASFLTVVDGEIFKGEVFAQIQTIVGQQPTVENDSLKMRFRTWNHWTKMVGTNGYTTAFMTDYQSDTLVGGNVDRKGATIWYVELPCL